VPDPPATCGGVNGHCGGTCPHDGQCLVNVISNLCRCFGGTNLACGDSAPVCNGQCPAGMHCGGIDFPTPLGRNCGCVPDGAVACGDATFPTCGGACPDTEKVCRPVSRRAPLAVFGIGCECSAPGACAVGADEPSDLQECGGGADCPADLICETGQDPFATLCAARCVAP